MKALFKQRNQLLFKRIKYVFFHFFCFLSVSTIFAIMVMTKVDNFDYLTIFFTWFSLFKLPVFHLMFSTLREEKESFHKAFYFKQNGLSISTCIKYYLSWFGNLHTGIFLSAFHYKILGPNPYWFSLIMYIFYHLTKVSQTMFFNLVLNDSMFCLLFSMFGSIIAPFCYSFQCRYWAMVIINFVYPESSMFYIIGSSSEYEYSRFSIDPHFADFSFNGFVVLFASAVLYFVLCVVIDYNSLRKTFRRFKLTNETDALNSINKKEIFLPNGDDTSSVTTNNRESLIINNVSIAQTCQSKQLNDINIELNENDILCVLGYEDKTTLLKIISGELAPHSGDVVYNGFTFNKNPEMFVYNILHISHSTVGIFLDELTLNDNVLRFMKLYKCSYVENDVNDTLNYLSLFMYKNMLYGDLSEEDKVKVLIACAVCSNKKVIIFDEAFIGLNIASRIKALELIKRIQSNKIIIIGTTTLGEINYLLHTKIAVMKEGRLLCLGSKDSITNQYQFGFNLKIKFNDYQNSSSANDVFDSHKLLYHNIKTILPSAEIHFNHKSVLSINFYENNIESINQLLQMFKEQPNPLIEDISLTTRTMKEYFYYNNTPNTNWLNLKDSNEQRAQKQFTINDGDDANSNRSSLNINNTESSILSLPKTSFSCCTQFSLEFTRYIAYFLSHKANTFITMFYCFCGPLLMLCSFTNSIDNIDMLFNDYDNLFNTLTPFHLGIFIYSLNIIRYPFTDRTSGFKTVYKLSNGSLIVYWFAHYVFDILQFCFILIIASPFFSVVDHHFFYIVIYLLVYVLGYLPFMYMFSFFLHRFNVAIKIIPLIILVFVPLGSLDLELEGCYYVIPQVFWVVGLSFEKIKSLSGFEILHNLWGFGLISLFTASGIHIALYWIIVFLLEYNIPWKLVECFISCCVKDNVGSMAFLLSLHLNIKPYVQYKVNPVQYANVGTPVTNNNDVFIPSNMNALNDVDINNNNNNNIIDNGNNINQDIVDAKPGMNIIPPPPSPYVATNNTTNLSDVVRPNFNYNITNVPDNNPSYQLQQNPVPNYANSLNSNKNYSVMLSSIKKKFVTCFQTTGHALRNTSLYLENKEGTCIIGLPESGKSTLFKVILNETTVNEGKAKIFNKGNAFTNFSAVRDCIGYIPQSNGLSEGLTVFKLLMYYITLIGYCDHMKILQHLLDVSGLYNIRNEYIDNISNSDKRKLHFIIMILKNPELMLLDSPTVGVEPSKQLEMWNTIEQMKVSQDVNDNFNVMLVSNDQYEIDKLSDSVAIMKYGCVIYKSNTEKIIKDYAPGYNINVLFEVNENDIGNEMSEDIYDELAMLMARSRTTLVTAAGINPLLYWRYGMLARFLREIKECSEKIVLKEIKNDFSFSFTLYRYDYCGEEHVKNNITLLQKMYSMKMNRLFSIKELSVREEEINDVVWYM